MQNYCITSLKLFGQAKRVAQLTIHPRPEMKQCTSQRTGTRPSLIVQPSHNWNAETNS